VRGQNIPKPVRNWNQCGLSSRVLDVLKKSGFERPMPIQAQALPVIMSGRDCIGIAKTGSGKTIAFLLPMLRHIKDQPPLASVRAASRQPIRAFHHLQPLPPFLLGMHARLRCSLCCAVLCSVAGEQRSRASLRCAARARE
jgi:DEAD/DEAH box helicase